ncbi:MAG: hypothetical protein IIC29_02395 [Chloroflexi bacterium]|nr:hypothetical protein [Chloroflexota bacterium]
MIRITRTFNAKPEKEHDLTDVLKDIRGYAHTQDVESRIFWEPWGPEGVVHLHNDFGDAGEAQIWWQNLLSNSRVQEFIAHMENLIEGHREASFLMETGESSSSPEPTQETERAVRIVYAYNAKPGRIRELVEVANDIKGFVASQGIPVAVFTEPWGIGGRLHYHVDYPDAGSALSGLENIIGRQRGQEMRALITTLTQGHARRGFLYEVE